MVIKYATIGTSSITDSFIAAARATDKWQLVAVYSRSSETAQAFAAKHSATQSYTSLDQLTQDPDVEAVYIASPNSLHLEHAKKVLEAGKHAIVEKPIVSNLREFDELARAAKLAPNGARLIEAYRHLNEINFSVLREALPRIGKICGAHLVFASYSSRFDAVRRGETPNIFSTKYSGGCLVDMGVYPLAFALALFGKPREQAYYPIMLHTGTDAGGAINLVYETFTITIQTSKCYTSRAVSEIFGELGTLAINSVTDIDSVELRTIADKAVHQLANQKAKHNLMEEAQEFYQLISEKDSQGVEELLQLSRMVVEVTQDLRRQNKIEFAADNMNA